ncbi:MAG: hypothetical protein DSM106950_27160 [Stigonema ocellatum SAG 48.90 = DSM 106950]|nr:hypothetical protein [Stigonema ocellatum SAG 48.90 = DSM 106950]
MGKYALIYLPKKYAIVLVTGLLPGNAIARGLLPLVKPVGSHLAPAWQYIKKITQYLMGFSPRPHPHGT